jgi:hypothetical protein
MAVWTGEMFVRMVVKHLGSNTRNPSAKLLVHTSEKSSSPETKLCDCCRNHKYNTHPIYNTPNTKFTLLSWTECYDWPQEFDTIYGKCWWTYTNFVRQHNSFYTKIFLGCVMLSGTQAPMIHTNTGTIQPDDRWQIIPEHYDFHTHTHTHTHAQCCKNFTFEIHSDQSKRLIIWLFLKDPANFTGFWVDKLQ